MTRKRRSSLCARSSKVNKSDCLFVNTRCSKLLNTITAGIPSFLATLRVASKLSKGVEFEALDPERHVLAI